MATYVNDLRLKEIATGDESGTWGTSTNTNLELIAEAFSFGTEAITTNADTHTTTIADGSTDPGRSLFLKYTGTLDSTCTITIGPNTVSKLWFIENATSGSQSIIISQGSGASITILNGQTKAIYSDGAGSGAAMVDAFTDLSVPSLFLPDNGKAIFGEGSDLQIYHDGSHSRIDEQGTGVLFLQTNGTNIQLNKGTSENMLVANVDGSVDLYYDNSKKLATTSTGIDVTGTAVTDGLTVSAPSGDTPVSIVTTTAGSFLSLSDGNTTSGRSPLVGAITDAMVFYTSAGSYNERMRIDSSGNVGIAASSPSEKLHVVGASINVERQSNTAGFGSGVKFSLGDSASTTANHTYGAIFGIIEDNTNGAEDGYLSLQTSLSGSLGERMRIDSVGRVFIGNANNDTNPASTGSASNKGATFGGTSDPYLSIGRVGEAAAVLGRIDSAGDIILFYGDGSTVGSIGTGSGLLTIGTGTGNLVFENALVAPCSDSSVGSSNGVVDLGQSARRFKDLYLSGGAYLGGTAAANKLDDYEEGTWTPNGNWSSTSAHYVKIGNLVHLSIDAVANATGGTSIITNLPFGSEGTVGTGIYTSSVNWADGYTSPTFVVAGSTGYFRVVGDQQAFTSLGITAGGTVHIAITYQTT